MKKKVLALVLCLAMVLSLVPAMSFAASAEESEPVKYIERTWNGTKVVEIERNCAEYVVADANTAEFEDGKWYVVNSDVTNNNSITVSGTANLILADGCTFKASNGIDVERNSALNIYGQCDGSGALTAVGTSESAAISTLRAVLNIHGGTVNATGGWRGAGIGGGYECGGGTVNVYGGTVNAKGGQYGAGIGGGYYGDGCAVNIYGGTVTATGVDDAAGIGGGYRGNGGTVNVYGGDMIAISGGRGRAIGAGSEGDYDGNVYAADKLIIKAGDTAPGTIKSLEDCVQHKYKYVSITSPRIQYIERTWNGEKVAATENERVDYIFVDENTEIFEDGKWYVVKGELVNSNRIEVDGTANLILTDECDFTLSNGIHVSLYSTLNIYGQADGDGTLTAYANSGNAAIGGYIHYDGGTVNVHGGIINATGGEDAAGIGGGEIGSGATVNVYGGTVTATGGANAAGIGGGREGHGATVNIYCGEVTATGGQFGAGIGGGDEGDGGTVTVYEGVVTAVGGTNAAGIGGGYYANGGTVELHGGDVTAISGGDGRAIGAGYGGSADGTFTAESRLIIKAGDSAPDTVMSLQEYEQYGYKYVNIAPPTFRYISRAWKHNQVVATENRCTDFVILDENTEVFEDGKWYIASGNVVNENRIEVNGKANLILCDGCSLTLNSGIHVLMDRNGCNTLNIYAQSEGTGTLSAAGAQNNAAIGGDYSRHTGGGVINIHGGIINAVGGGEAAGIGGATFHDCGDVTVYDGTITATGGQRGAGIGGGLIGAGSPLFTVYGGTVTAIGGENAAGIGGGHKCNNGGTLNILGGVVTAIGGEHSRAVGAGADYEGEEVGVATVGAGLTLKGGENERDVFVMAAIGAEKYIHVDAFEPVVPVKYIDRSWDGSKVVEIEKECTDYIPVNEFTTKFDRDNWYVVTGEVNNLNRIETTGTVNLILADGCNFTVNKGIGVSSWLHIYDQAEGTGKLNAYGYNNGNAIGGTDDYGGTIYIHGGNVTAAGSAEAAGIGGVYRSKGCHVDIFGGTVTATGGQYGAGIGGGYLGNGSVCSVYGGTVTAIGGAEAPGIGGGCAGNGGFFDIYGGTVTVTGGYKSPGIGGSADWRSRGCDVHIYGGDMTVIGGGDREAIYGTITLHNDVKFGAGADKDNIMVRGDNSNVVDAMSQKYFVTPYSWHIHDFADDYSDNGDGTHSRKCKGCDETVDTAEHILNPATCTEPKTCSVCGATVGSPIGHTYVPGVMISEATCTKAAIYHAECSQCGETSDTFEVGNPKGHIWRNATCTEYAKCSVCGEKKTPYVEPLGHDYRPMTKVCDDPLTYTALCVRCGETTDNYRIPEKEFDYTDTVTYQSIAKGDILRGGTKIVATSGWGDGEMTVIIDGRTVAKVPSGQEWTLPQCVKCVDYDTAIIPVRLTIRFETVCEYTLATCESPKTCVYCGHTVGSALGHTFENGVCTECGFAQFKFNSASLVLSGELVMDINCTVGDIEAVKDGYMEMTVGSTSTQKVYLSDAAHNADGTYSFPCYLNVLQMADDITLSFHYGDTVVGPYTKSVAQYLNNIKSKYGDNAELVALAEAIADYGHFAQPALQEANGFEDGKYQTMNRISNAAFTLPDAADLASYQATKNGSITQITGVSRALALDHGTDILLYFNCADGYTPDIAVTDKDGNAVACPLTKDESGRYVLTIPNISAHRLGDFYTVSFDNGAMTIDICALSYAYSVLNSSASSTNQKNAVAALYAYYQAAIAYQAAHE